MNIVSKFSQRVHQKGLRATLRSAYKRYVFFHWELLWMERDLVSPVPPHSLKPYPPLRVVKITADNASAFARYFGDRVGTYVVRGVLKDEGPARVLDGNFVLMDIAAAQLAFARLGRSIDVPGIGHNAPIPLGARVGNLLFRPPGLEQLGQLFKPGVLDALIA